MARSAPRPGRSSASPSWVAPSIPGCSPPPKAPGCCGSPIRTSGAPPPPPPCGRNRSPPTAWGSSARPMPSWVPTSRGRAPSSRPLTWWRSGEGTGCSTRATGSTRRLRHGGGPVRRAHRAVCRCLRTPVPGLQRPGSRPWRGLGVLGPRRDLDGLLPEPLVHPAAPDPSTAGGHHPSRLHPGGPYLAAGGPPPSLEALGPSVWPRSWLHLRYGRETSRSVSPASDATRPPPPGRRPGPWSPSSPPP